MTNETKEFINDLIAQIVEHIKPEQVGYEDRLIEILTALSGSAAQISQNPQEFNEDLLLEIHDRMKTTEENYEIGLINAIIAKTLGYDSQEAYEASSNAS